MLLKVTSLVPLTKPTLILRRRGRCLLAEVVVLRVVDIFAAPRPGASDHVGRPATHGEMKIQLECDRVLQQQGQV
jgi:hypothetical protein